MEDTNSTDDDTYSLNVTVDEYSDELRDGDRETVRTVVVGLDNTFTAFVPSEYDIELSRFGENLVIRIDGNRIAASTGAVRRRTDVSRVDMLAYSTGDVKITLKD
jgi:hypothetical protein